MSADTRPVNEWPAPSPVAPPAPPSARKKRWLLGLPWWALILVVLAGVTVISSAISTATKKHNGTTVSNGVGTRDASDDVYGASIAAPDAIGAQYVTALVTNYSSKRSNYWITATIVSPNGATQYDSVTLIVNDLEPGQTATAKGLPSFDVPSGAIVRITTVQRTAP